MTDSTTNMKRMCINCDFYSNGECYAHPPEILQGKKERGETFQLIPKVRPDRLVCTYFQVEGVVQ